MRQILFRGKRVDNGEWLFGDLLKVSKSHLIAPYDGDWYDFMPPKSTLGLPSNRYVVDPKTVGQFIGVKDKNGVKIFEGDLIPCDITEEHRSKYLIKYSEGVILNGCVQWNEHQVMFEIVFPENDHGVVSRGFGWSGDEFEIIGNIYEDKPS